MKNDVLKLISIPANLETLLRTEAFDHGKTISEIIVKYIEAGMKNNSL